ncbi:MAG TPA: GrpB family protein [Dehalococcoidia bacterium]|nr:GrpB family protein [Dehalococcoidia bacterium]
MSYPAVLIFDYDPRWPHRFEEEKRRVAESLGPRALAIEHVGSTSVPGLGAKPVIDIMVGVGELAEGEECIAPLRAIGYEFIPRRNFPECYFFVRGPWRARLFHLHLTKYRGPMWNRYLLFRDYLRDHPEVARQYQERKREIALEIGARRYAYSVAKRPFIDEIMSQLVGRDETD